MTYHKIINVPLTTCTAEQMIAYNLAWSYHDLFIKEYQRMPMQFQKHEVIIAARDFMMQMYDGKYDRDAIQCCLNAGLENYLNDTVHIYCDYKTIGEMFPAHYLEVNA